MTTPLVLPATKNIALSDAQIATLLNALWIAGNEVRDKNFSALETYLETAARE